MKLIINSSYEKYHEFTLNDERIDKIKKNCKDMSELIDTMIKLKINYYVIDIGDNFFEIFCDMIDEKQPSLINKIGTMPYMMLRLKLAHDLMFNDEIISKIFDSIDINDRKNDFKKYIQYKTVVAQKNNGYLHECANQFMSNTSNYLKCIWHYMCSWIILRNIIVHDYIKFISFTCTSLKGTFSYYVNYHDDSIDNFTLKCLENVTNDVMLEKIFTMENIDHMKNTSNKSFAMLCKKNPIIRELYKKYDNCTIMWINNIQKNGSCAIEKSGENKWRIIEMCKKQSNDLCM
jgi:hypothetical protein